MTITGKKFSQLTNEQKIATRIPITGWLVNNVLINPLSQFVSFVNLADLGLTEDVCVHLIQNSDNGLTIETTNGGGSPIGTYNYIINWGTAASNIKAGIDMTLLPYNNSLLNKPFGVYKIELTDVNEWTITVVENGEILDGSNIG